ncbi:hypothetical protein FSP39_005840 [Pinctada imbricata]|uniref:DDB1- and CUL4-associated factor 13 n=1 Tax=Pinctada imbricata TaxID=66713 RepID=A0AA88XN97_PINIB|nr:hypothetical protein FSP39_005840 [Pinctada imbricata]
MLWHSTPTIPVQIRVHHRPPQRKEGRVLRDYDPPIDQIPRNYDPSLHPFEAPREYVRALNATKLERVFAKPFLGALDGHKDGVNCLCKDPTRLSSLISASYDGEVRIWNLSQRTCVKTLQAHDGLVQGLCCHPKGNKFFTCGSDQVIKQWRYTMEEEMPDEPVSTILGKTVVQCIDHHWSDDVYATCGDQVDIWNEARTEPIRSFKWNVDGVHHIKFNPVEKHLIGGCASDRSIILYDIRGSSPLRKVILKLKSNAIAWNPMEAYVFTAANEDYNLYSFDMRNLSLPINVHMDHTSAVMDVDYSPTGKEFVTACYDKSLRIFPTDKGHSREIYHTKRMQRVRIVKWSLDNRYILSGSDEMNIRIWKARASEKLGTLSIREKTSFNYGEKLKEKFQHHPEIKRISRHRHVPKHIYTASAELRQIRMSKRRKEANRRAHSKPGAVPHVPARKKQIVREVE